MGFEQRSSAAGRLPTTKRDCCHCTSSCKRLGSKDRQDMDKRRQSSSCSLSYHNSPSAHAKMAHFHRMIQQYDVACFQEVRPGFADAVRGCAPLCSVYQVSPQDVRPYGCLLMVRRDLQPDFACQPLKRCGYLASSFVLLSCCTLTVAPPASCTPI